VGPAKNFYNADGTSVDTAIQAALTTGYTALISAISGIGAGVQLVVLSRKLATHTEITAAACRSYIGVQRRRLHSP
jgi:hypothetical protein